MFNFKTLFHGTLSAIFPSRCVACDIALSENAYGDLLCEACYNFIEPLHGLYCPACNRRIPNVTERCHSTMSFTVAAAVSFKNKAVPALIHAYKYKNMNSAEKILGGFLKTYYEMYILPGLSPRERWITIPIPLHKNKERARGFNQTIRMYEFLLKQRTVLPPLVQHALIRIKNTPSQTQCKNFEERAENIKGSFALENTERVRGKNILLLDDVFTSGATLNEAAHILKSSGAKKIIGLVIAKA